MMIVVHMKYFLIYIENFGCYLFGNIVMAECLMILKGNIVQQDKNRFVNFCVGKQKINDLFDWLGLFVADTNQKKI